MEHLDQNIRERLSRYLESEAPLDEFREWFASEAWAQDDDLVDEVALLLAEYSNGDRSEQDLRREFAARIGSSGVISGSLLLSRGHFSANVAGRSSGQVDLIEWSVPRPAELSEHAANESALPEDPERLVSA